MRSAAYAREGEVVCFFQSSQELKTRYAILRFNDKAHLDEGATWPTASALQKLSARDATRIAALAQKAASLQW